MSQQALANAASMGQSDISKLERGIINETSGIVRLAMALDVSPVYLETGDEQYANLKACEPLVNSGNTNSAPQGWVTDCSIDIRGNGKPGQPEKTVTTMQLCHHWVHNKLPDITHTDNLALLSVIDSGMEPTFGRGDVLIIDRGITTIEQSAVYVFTLDGQVFVRRIVRNPITGTMAARSDNALHGSFEIIDTDTDRLKIHGRVCFAWRGAIV